jgi:transketolase
MAAKRKTGTTKMSKKMTVTKMSSVSATAKAAALKGERPAQQQSGRGGGSAPTGTQPHPQSKSVASSAAAAANVVSSKDSAQPHVTNDEPKDVQKHDAKPVEKALREGFGEGLVIAGREDKNVVALSADLTESNRMEDFKKEFPDRFVETGIMEQHLVSCAAGMAHAGKVAFCASFAVFSPGRSWDQVRVSCAYSNANVKIYGGHAGITVGEDGATHQALEDIAITRVLPRMAVIVPADAIEMRKATIAAAKMSGPVYLRGGRVKRPLVTTEEMPFTIGKANVLRPGKDVTLIACGLLVKEAMLAADELKKQGIVAGVIDLHTIKPIDADAIIAAAAQTGAVVTAEEHQVTGGMGSAVCEVLAREYPVPVELVGVKDTFCESGTADLLLDKYGLRCKDIVEAAKRVISRKKERKPATFAPKTALVKKATRRR